MSTFKFITFINKTLLKIRILKPFHNLIMYIFVESLLPEINPFLNVQKPFGSSFNYNYKTHKR